MGQTLEHYVGEKRENNRFIGGFHYTLKAIEGSTVKALCRPWGGAIDQGHQTKIIDISYETWLQFAFVKKGTGTLIDFKKQEVSNLINNQ